MALLDVKTDELLRLPRKDSEALRLTQTRAKTEYGKNVAWYSLEVGDVSEKGDFFERKKIMIRGKELEQVVRKLHAACFGNPPPGAHLDVELPEEPPPPKPDF